VQSERNSPAMRDHDKFTQEVILPKYGSSAEVSVPDVLLNEGYILSR